MSLSNMTSFVIGLASNTDDAEFQMEPRLFKRFKRFSESHLFQTFINPHQLAATVLRIPMPLWPD